MVRFLSAVSLVALVACQPAIPDSGAGVGFDDYNSYQNDRAARDAALTGQPQPQTGDRIESVTITGDTGGTATAADTTVGAPLDVTAAAQTPTVPQDTSVISDEQNFGAVSERESIESDAARIARNREQYQVIQPTALPSRARSGPNIVDYALKTTNSVGQSIYRRSAFATEAKFQRNCAQYASADQAQQAFLLNGGPSRDRQGLDPDGDGFACAWNPAPYRLVRQ